MPYHIAHNTSQCSGYSVVKDADGKMMGCHPSKQEALAQMAALHASEADSSKFWGHFFSAYKDKK